MEHWSFHGLPSRNRLRFSTGAWRNGYGQVENVTTFQRPLGRNPPGAGALTETKCDRIQDASIQKPQSIPSHRCAAELLFLVLVHTRAAPTSSGPTHRPGCQS